MKKFIFTIAALFLGISQMSAQQLIFEDVDLPKGGQVTLTVKYTTGGESLTSASFTLSLPAGVSSEKNSVGKSKFVVNSDIEEFFTAYTTATDGYGIAATTTGVELPGPDGILGTITLFADADAENLVVGESYPVTLTNVSLVKRSDAGPVSIYFEDLSFNVNIVENRIELDENATELPNVTGLQNVLVKRTIKKDQWNTICLPFAMTAKQVTDAFGEDVKLADFIGCTVEQAEDAEYASSIQVNFQSVTEMAANRPYLIKVLNPISYEEGFKVDDVTVEPNDAPVNAQDEYEYTHKVGNRWVTDYYYNSFYGTYVANTEIPAGSIILSGNKFYYTKGTTTKGFRGWFSFDNCALDDIDLAYAAVKIFIDDDVTVIDGIDSQRNIEGVYDLSGRKIKVENNDLNTLQKGVYIIDGKKVTIK